MCESNFLVSIKVLSISWYVLSRYVPTVGKKSLRFVGMLTGIAIGIGTRIQIF